jgi:putative DNA primase/helicase
MKFYPEHIPAELKASKQWALWRREERDGKPAKVPYQPDGKRAKSNDPLTWCSFNVALTTFQDVGGLNGICWMMPKEPVDIIFIDIDHCIKDGIIEPWALETIKKLDSYTERSQSGKGLHILIRGKKPIRRCRKAGSPYEIYDCLRPCYLTGDVVDNLTQIEERKDALDALFEEIFSKEMKEAREGAKHSCPPPQGGSGLSDETLLMKARLSKDGREFEALWNGVLLGYNGDDSAADLAMMNRLAFWTGGDAAQMERLFSRSGLGQREKWRNRPDYRERTIQRAISDAREFYGPPKDNFSKARERTTEASHGHRERNEQAEFSLEDVANIEYDDSGKVESAKLSPTRAARAVLERMPLAMSENSEDIYRFNGQIYKPDGARTIDRKLCSVAEDRVTTYALKETLRRIRNELLEKPVKFDPDPYLLGIKNGVVDLKTGEFREYRPEDLITDQIHVQYDPAARCPRFVQFLEEVCPNPIDRLMLVDWYTIHAIRYMFPYVMFLNGLGRNGKGIYERVMQRIYGEQAFSHMPLEELLVKNNRFAGADLAGKRGQIVAEAGESHAKGKRTIPTAFLKNATGDGIIDSDQKNKGRIKFKPFYKSTIDANDMPRIEDTSKGWVERFCKADMPFHFVDNPLPGTIERKKDPALFEKLTTESELSGILNLIIDRVPEIIRTKTITKRPGAEMFAEYQRQSSSITTFLETFCDYEQVSNNSNDIFLDIIFSKYEEWCDRTVADKVDAPRFGKAVKTFCKGIEPERVRDGDKKRKIYPGLSFDVNRYQAHCDQYSTTEGPVKTATAPLGPVNGEKTWQYIKEKFGYISAGGGTNLKQNGNTPHFSPNGADSDSKNGNAPDSGANGPQERPTGADSDLSTENDHAASSACDCGETALTALEEGEEIETCILKTKTRDRVCYRLNSDTVSIVSNVPIIPIVPIVTGIHRDSTPSENDKLFGILETIGTIGTDGTSASIVTLVSQETVKAVLAFEKEGKPIIPFKLGQFLGLQTIGPLVKALKALGYRETKARSFDGMWIWSNVFPEEDGSVVSLGAIT